MQSVAHILDLADDAFVDLPRGPRVNGMAVLRLASFEGEMSSACATLLGGRRRGGMAVVVGKACKSVEDLKVTTGTGNIETYISEKRN